MSILGFKSRADPFACILHHLRTMDSSDLRLVRPAWQPSHFSIHILAHVQVLVGLESGIESGALENDTFRDSLSFSCSLLEFKSFNLLHCRYICLQQQPLLEEPGGHDTGVKDGSRVHPGCVRYGEGYDRGR